MHYLKYLDKTGKKKKKLKKRSTSSRLYNHQLSRFVASPHKHTAIGAITQLSQGGVTIHHLSQDGFISLLTFLIHKKSFGNTALIHRSIFSPVSCPLLLERRPRCTCLSGRVQSFFTQEAILSAGQYVTTLTNSFSSKLILQRLIPCWKGWILVM